MKRVHAFVLGALLVAVALVVFVAPHASSKPDGLAKVAADQQFDRLETRAATDGSPLAGYAVDGVDDSTWSTRVAGLAGVALTFAIGAGVFAVLKRRRPETATGG